MRRALVTTVAAVIVAAVPSAPASAAPVGETARSLADRVAEAWPSRQQPSGLFEDYVAERPSEGYANTLIGYGLMRTGLRGDDDGLVGAGIRGVDSIIARKLVTGGDFEFLGVARAYNLARAEIPDDPRFARVRARWETYLRQVAPQPLEETATACNSDPNCYFNHQIVAAVGNVELLRTGLKSNVSGARLANPVALRRSVLHIVDEVVPNVIGSNARSSAFPRRVPLGLLSDNISARGPGPYPPAYHALSALMLGQALEGLGENGGAGAPRARASLRRAMDTLSAFMAPDGDIAWMGARQEQAWVLAATAAGAETAARTFRRDEAFVRRCHAIAERAMDRLVRVNGFGVSGINATPRLRPNTGNYAGLDHAGATVVSNGLTTFFLHLAADEAERAPQPQPSRLAFDRPDATFLDPDQNGFATVRRGDLWYAIRRRVRRPDLRTDFGIMALKRRGGDGTWEDVVRPRPVTRFEDPFTSAGPVIVRDGERWLPYGDRMEVRPRGVVVVHGRFVDSEDDSTRRSGVTFRFAPVRDGLRLTFPYRRGDRVEVTTFLPKSALRAGDGSVSDDRSVATLSPKPTELPRREGYASCCDASLVGAGMAFEARADGRATYVVRARSGGGGDGGIATPPLVALIAGPTLLVAAVVLRMATLRRRRRRRAALRAERLRFRG